MNYRFHDQHVIAARLSLPPRAHAFVRTAKEDLPAQTS